MGLLPKYKVEELKRQKRLAKQARRRKVGTRPQIVRFLIVCEGTKTEPDYFRALVSNDYSEVRSEEIIGEGRSTVALVERTMQIRAEIESRKGLKFDRVWVVFDRDDNEDFNEAIALAGKYGFHAAWSNNAFELWYLLHFQYCDTAITRYAYIEKLESAIRSLKGDNSFVYKKGDGQMYTLLQETGDESKAIRWARNLRKNYSGNDFAKMDPCTMVFKLVEELRFPEKLL